MPLEFTKAYNVTEMIKKEKEKLFLYQETKYERVYIAEDTKDMQIYRVLKNHNKEYEIEEGTYLVEWNKIPKCYVAEKLIGMEHCNKKLIDRFAVNNFIHNCKFKDIFLATLLLDNDTGLENWDNKECYSIEEAIEIIDGGYGIIEKWE